MKKSFKILVPLLFMAILLTGCTKPFDHYEDKLYSEKTVLGDKNLNTKATNVLTRENAIKKVLDIFDKGLNIKIDRTNFTENIKLFKDYSIDSLQWHITWYEDYGKIFYSCVLDSSTGNIMQLQLNTKSNLNNNPASRLSILEITNLLKPLLKQLQLDVNNYTIVPTSSYYSDNYMNVILCNKKNQTKEYIVTIDLSNKLIVNFFSLNNQAINSEKATNGSQQIQIGEK
ncbi:hypothetical protein RBU49_05430 [Clostridium sp. MB40-C1]|uniref:hypothetical protein n=1 Tax=Clostridium sp. MB40-C1 TaxID=3070996 RepID=UPI0027DF8634|nr:hypothetical protein [Clostridium sp. MB40-C1]WMJ81689.1 hypothetical protein RBU49_05430 [Clostridium sp. MB40-C1]